MAAVQSLQRCVWVHKKPEEEQKLRTELVIPEKLVAVIKAAVHGNCHECPSLSVELCVFHHFFPAWFFSNI